MAPLRPVRRLAKGKKVSKPSLLADTIKEIPRTLKQPLRKTFKQAGQEVRRMVGAPLRKPLAPGELIKGAAMKGAKAVSKIPKMTGSGLVGRGTTLGKVPKKKPVRSALQKRAI